MSGESLSAGELTPERVEQFVAARRAGSSTHSAMQVSGEGTNPAAGFTVAGQSLGRYEHVDHGDAERRTYDLAILRGEHLGDRCDCPQPQPSRALLPGKFGPR